MNVRRDINSSKSYRRPLAVTNLNEVNSKANSKANSKVNSRANLDIKDFLTKEKPKFSSNIPDLNLSNNNDNLNSDRVVEAKIQKINEKKIEKAEKTEKHSTLQPNTNSDINNLLSSSYTNTFKTPQNDTLFYSNQFKQKISTFNNYYNTTSNVITKQAFDTKLNSSINLFIENNQHNQYTYIQTQNDNHPDMERKMNDLINDISKVKEINRYYLGLDKFRMNFSPGSIRPKSIVDKGRSLKRVLNNQIDLKDTKVDQGLDFKILTSKDRYNAKLQSISNGTQKKNQEIKYLYTYNIYKTSRALSSNLL